MNSYCDHLSYYFGKLEFLWSSDHHWTIHFLWFTKLQLLSTHRRGYWKLVKSRNTDWQDSWTRLPPHCYRSDSPISIPHHCGKTPPWAKVGYPHLNQPFQGIILPWNNSSYGIWRPGVKRTTPFSSSLQTELTRQSDSTTKVLRYHMQHYHQHTCCCFRRQLCPFPKVHTNLTENLIRLPKLSFHAATQVKVRIASLGSRTT